MGEGESVEKEKEREWRQGIRGKEREGDRERGGKKGRETCVRDRERGRREFESERTWSH